VDALLALEDGRVFRGRHFGAVGERLGEVVFNTSMSGYQEVLTDPSYKGQIVVMTYPEIGNYGVNDEDIESARPQVEGFAVRELSEVRSNWRARNDLHAYLKDNGIVGISEVDTRAITRHIRSAGAMKGCLSSVDRDAENLVRKAVASPGLSEIDLVGMVTVPEIRPWQRRDRPWARPAISRPVADPPPHVVAYDFGMKRNILRCLGESGCRVTVVPAGTSAADTLALRPDGVFLSNGPGDPAAATYAVEAVRGLWGKVPIFGICLGHQILGIAAGGKTFKLKFGHRGSNQPVKDLTTGRVEITAQNHGYAVDPDSLPPESEVTHLNLNDGTVEGVRQRDVPVFSVQYHPEASPGPHDSLYLFDRFLRMIAQDACPDGGSAPRDAEGHRV
jgi:carbamoyl-phosphate synthase small subunit